MVITEYHRDSFEKTYDNAHSFNFRINGYEFLDLIDNFFKSHNLLVPAPQSIFFDLMLIHLKNSLNFIETIATNTSFQKFKSHVDSGETISLVEFYESILDNIKEIFKQSAIKYCDVCESNEILLDIKDGINNEKYEELKFIDLLTTINDGRNAKEISVGEFITMWAKYVLFLLDVVFPKTVGVPEHIKILCENYEAIDGLYLRI